MITNTLVTLFKRDLEKLRTEIMAYQDEKNLWLVSGNITNSGGNLALHLVGNLNHFIGAEIGQTGYVRQREEEFSNKDVPREEIAIQITATAQTIEAVLTDFPESKLQEQYPREIFGHPMTYEYFLTHLAIHLGYHLGQVNYHRRLLDK